MRVLRTPEERFEGLEDWNFAPRYRAIRADDGTELRFHFVDEGPRDVAPVLLLHGNPSWSYLHRHMIHGLVARGHRAIALDLMGLGRSDKPDDPAFFTLERHVAWVSDWLAAEDLHSVTLYCQDWGGLIGLLAVQRQPERVARICASNTGIPVGEGVSRFMQQWLEFSQSLPELDVGALVAGGTHRTLSAGELRAYNAPYPDGSYQAAVKRFPLLIPVQPDNPGVPACRAAWAFYETWRKPFLTIFGALDPVATRPGAHLRFQERIPGAQGQPHRVLADAHHFIQEDAPQALVDALDTFVRA